MHTYQMALLLHRLFTLEGKPVKERSAEDKATITQIRGTLAGALPTIFEQAGTKEADIAAYTDAVLADHE